MSSPESRILIIYPYPSLDTNPTMVLLLEALAERGVPADVLLMEGGGFTSPEPFGPNIHLHFLPWPFFELQNSTATGFPRRLARKLLAPRGTPADSWFADPVLHGLFKSHRYAAIVGVDPPGIILADRLNRWSRRPLVYISFEILFAAEICSPDEETLHTLETAACSRTSLVLIQDEERAEAFCAEKSFARDKTVLVPVAPPPEAVLKTDLLRELLGIPASQRIVLYCGNFDVFASPEQVIEMALDWPDEYALVIHGRARTPALKWLAEPGKIYISSEPVSRKTLSALVASADFGLAPYRPIAYNWQTGDNIYHLGFASGKVSYYALCGLPILARSLPVYVREFGHYDCGKVYRRGGETAALLDEMSADYAAYSQRARQFYDERLNPLFGMQQFCDRLLELAAAASRASGKGVSVLPQKPGTRLVIVARTYPEFDCAAGCLRLFEIIQILVQEGFHLTFLSLQQTETRYRDALEALGVECVCDVETPLLDSPGRFEAFLKTHDFQVAFFVFHHIYSTHAPQFRASLPGCRLILDTVDLNYVREHREATLRGDPALLEQAAQTRQDETQAILAADAVLVVTEHERQILVEEAGVPRSRIEIVPTIHRLDPELPDRAERDGIVFIGGYWHTPNVDAVQFFMEEVFPVLITLLPEVRVTLAGSHTPDDFYAYSAVHSQVSVPGFVQDHRALLKAHRVGIAPLRYGAGMKGKIGEYFACGLPCVTTSIGAEGMGLQPECDVLLADDPAEFAQAIARLYTDAALWHTLSQAGQRYIQERVSPVAAVSPLLRAIHNGKQDSAKSAASGIRETLGRWFRPRRAP